MIRTGRFFAVMVIGWAMLSFISFGYSGGDGSAGNPYQIADVNDLLELGADTSNYNKCFILADDIDLAGRTFIAAIIAPDSIDDSTYYFQGSLFTGVFDGGGHTISNLTISTSTNDYIGLFGYIGSNGHVNNLNLEEGVITGSYYVGGICGYNAGTLSQCCAIGEVTGSFYVGGLCGYNGYNPSSVIDRCYTNGKVAGSSYVGGLCGYCKTGTIQWSYAGSEAEGSTSYIGGLCGVNENDIVYCYSTGQVTGGESVGGLCGGSGNSSGTMISHCYATGPVTGSSKVGGLCGSISYGMINQCYATSTVTGGGPYIGGLCGRNDYSTISQCYSAGMVTGTNIVGGLCGYQNGSSSLIEDCLWDKESSGKTIGYNQAYSAPGKISNVFGKTTAEMKTESAFTSIGWDFTYTDGDAAEWFLPENEYPRQICWITAIIPNVVDMRQEAAKAALAAVNFQTETVFIFNNTIPAGQIVNQSPAAEVELPCGSTVTLTASVGSKYTGSGTEEDPFRITSKYDLIRLGMTPADYSSYFVLMANIDLEGETFVRALIAPDSGSTFNGIFNGNGHIISNLKIVANSGYNIGLFGKIGIGGEIINFSLENTDITGYQYVGGLCGNNYGNITSCYATGMILGSSLCIPVCGQGDRCANCLGVLCGFNSGTINQSYASGTVAGVDAVGGLCGCNPGSINQCYATSIVTGSSSYAGGLCGYNSGTITASFWDTQTSGTSDGVGNMNPDPLGVTGKTTAEMQVLSTFTSTRWDFTNETANGTNNIWRMCVDGVDYPRLNWESIDGDFACPDGVSTEDLDYFVRRWLLDDCTSSNNYCGGVDVDSSGAVDLGDLSIFAGHWMEGV